MAIKKNIPYGRQQVDAEDIAAVVEVLQSDWLTTGPMVNRFEQAVADYTGAKYGVAVSSGTAALHAAMFAIGIGPGDEVIVPPMTFVATANAVIYQGGTPVFVDVDAETLLIDPVLVEEKITSNTKAIIAVDYAGQPCDYNALRKIADRHGLLLIADACHSLGGEYRGRKVGTLADLTVFSFHPVKPISTGEGGMVVTDRVEYAERMRCFRNHGIDNDHRQRTRTGGWFYAVTEIGYNYRLSDIQSALGLSQLNKLSSRIQRRQKLAGQYDRLFSEVGGINPLVTSTAVSHGYHLYVVRVAANQRERIFSGLREQGIGVNVHYIPVYQHPYYRDMLQLPAGLCPVAEVCFKEIISLPIFQQMTKNDQEYIARNVIALSG